MERFAQTVTIQDRIIGQENKPFIIAEISANHCQDLKIAKRSVVAAAEAGADAVKFQTYKPETISLNSSQEPFRRTKRNEYDTLYELYSDAYMPWNWHEELFEKAKQHDLICFSTPFDPTAVDFLESLDVPLYKVSSFDVINHPLLQKIGRTEKPVIMSTGMATLGEIDEAIAVLYEEGCEELVLLKCLSDYPASEENLNLRTIPHLRETFGVPVGLSDHTPDSLSSLVAVGEGISVIEKHFILDRDLESPDAEFSLTPEEFKSLVDQVKRASKSKGSVSYGADDSEQRTKKLRPSIFAVQGIKPGDKFTADNIQTIRPEDGLHPKYYNEILGREASTTIERGTPIDWHHVE